MADYTDIELVQKFMPPFGNTLGIEVVEASKDKIVAHLPVRPELCTYPDILHGGAVMGLADNLGAMATVLNLPKGGTTTTIESKTNFTAAIPMGKVAVATCTPIHRGRTTQVWETRVTRGEDGKLAAVVTQTQLVREAKG